MKTTVLRAILLLCSLLILPSSQILAATTEIEASAQYILGDNDSKLDGRRLALLEAKRSALEKAGTYLESFTEIRNSQVTTDQVRSYMAGFVEVKEMGEKWGLIGQSMAVTVTVVVLIDKDAVQRQIRSALNSQSALSALEDAHQQIKTYEAKVVELTRALEKAKGQQAETVKGSRDQALARIEIETLLMKGRVAVLGSDDEELGYVHGSFSPIIRERARRYLEDALKLDPAYPKTLIYWGALEIEENNFVDAGIALRKALSLAPDDAIGHYTLSFLLWAQGDKDGAIKEVRKAISLKPDLVMAHNGLSYYLRATGDMAGASREIKEAIRLNPNHPQPHNHLGHVLLDEGYLDDAIRELKEAIRLKPDYVDARHNLGRALKRKGDVSGAMQEFREVIRLRPDHSEAHNELGLILADRGDFFGAMQEYREAVRLQPTNSGYHNNLGMELKRLRQFNAAKEELQDAIRLQPDNAIAHWNLGLVLINLGDPISARQEIDKACELGDAESCKFLRKGK